MDERVFTLGFAFELSSGGWAGDVDGRIPLLKHQKALIINTTIFDQKSYQTGIEQAMTRLIDDWCLQYPGIKNVEHVYFYAMYDFDADKRQRYLEQAYQLGKEFDPSLRAASSAVAGRILRAAQVVQHGAKRPGANATKADGARPSLCCASIVMLRRERGVHMRDEIDDHEVRRIRQRIRRRLAAVREVATYIVVVGCLALIDWATGDGWWVQWVALIWGGSCTAPRPGLR